MAYSSFFLACVPVSNARVVYSVLALTVCTAVFRLLPTPFFMLGLLFSIFTMSLSATVTGR